MRRDTRFWKRVGEQLKVKHAAEDAKYLRQAIWGIMRRLVDSKGRVRLVTASGMHLTAARQLRREVEREGMAPSGRQWVRLRKRMAREEREARREKEKAA